MLKNFPFIELGLEHILDPNGYDHILFILVLCAAFSTKDWKKIFLLATAFTVGHSLTLALSSLEIVNVPGKLVEIVIAASILLTGVYNIYALRTNHFSMWLHYVVVSIFGLIHGLGFSNYFKEIMAGEDSIILPLFQFNIGVEVGQILIVIAYILIVTLLEKGLNVCQKYIGYFISIIAILDAIRMIIERI